jgi:hypothetical protein
MNEWIAPCGIDCEGCSIRRLPFDDAAAAECVAWFREMGWLKRKEGRAEAFERGMYCLGCRGDRSIHWSVAEDGRVDCFILDCCVDRKGHRSCAECEDFPCDRLAQWARENASYAAAFARLRSLRDKPAKAGGRGRHGRAPMSKSERNG